MSREPTPVRAVTAQALIACALLAGAVLTVTGPLRGDLAEARARLRSLRQQAERAVGVDPAETPRHERDADPDARAEEIRRRSERAADASALYDSIMRLAQTHRVRVDRLEPRDSRDRRSGDRPVVSTTFAVAATGEYERVVRFLEAIERETGYVTTVSVRVAPAPDAAGADRVVATFETEHRSFVAPAATAEARERPAPGDAE